MAERIADNAEHLVDEMKRKARRRLVGAIVLALGAAIVLPLLLEKEPRPLGDDVSVQIPPVDESKFVNRLTGKVGESKALPKAESKAESKASAPAAKAEAPAAAADPAPKSEPRTEPKPASAESGGDPKPASAAANPPPPAPAPPAAAPAPAPTPATAIATPAATAGASPSTQGAAPATPAKAEGYVVQLGSFIDDKGANALANKLKKSGYAAYVVPYETSRGTMWRVRVGGYATRPEADAARVALKGEGQNGIIVTAQ